MYQDSKTPTQHTTAATLQIQNRCKQNNTWDNASVKMHFTLFIRSCSTRWVQSKDVAKRAIQSWPAVMKVICCFQSMAQYLHFGGAMQWKVCRVEIVVF